MPVLREPRTLRVRLEPSPAGFEATVQAEVGDQIVATRTVQGATCEDVARAALLLVALGSLEAVAVPDENDAPPPQPAPHPAEPRRLAVHLGATFVMATGLGPLAVGAGIRAGVGVERSGWFRPELRAGFDLVNSGELANELGTARRDFFAGRLDACPVALGPPAAVVRLCAATAVGQIRARGANVPLPKDETRLYAAVGGLVHARIRLAGRLTAEVGAAALNPVTRHRFFFDPDATLLELDTVTLFGEAGLAWSIP